MADDIKKLIQVELKKALRELGAEASSTGEEFDKYKYALKSALDDLKDMTKEYNKIIKQVDTIKDTSVSTSDAQIDLMKASQSVFAEELKLKKLKQSGIDLMSSEYKLVQANYKIAKEEEETAKKMLETEKQVSRQIGFSGKLMGGLAEKLGFGAEAQAAMSLEARKMVATNGKVVSGFGAARAAIGGMAKGIVNSLAALGPMGIAVGGIGLAIKGASMAGDALGSAMGKAGGMIKGLSEDSSDFMTNLTAPINDMIGKIPIVGGLLSGLMTFWVSILDLIIGVDDRIFKLGKQIGLTAQESRKLNDSFKISADRLKDAYITSIEFYESQVELSKVTGLNNIISEENLETNYKLKEFAGMELESRAKLLEIFRMTGYSTSEIAKKIAGQVGNFSKLTGISFNFQAILKEASAQSGRLGLMFSKYPEKVTQTLMTVKALGLEMKQLEAIGDNILDFESSIAKEFEVQTLLGKEINLNRARDLVQNNKLEEAALEISKQLNMSSEEFLKLKRLEADSIADLMGLNRDSFADMLRQQELLSKVGATSVAQMREKLLLTRHNTAEQERLKKIMGEENFEREVSMSMQDKLMKSFEKIKRSLVDYLTQENVLSKVESLVKKLTDPKNIDSIISTAKDVMFKVFGFVIKVTDQVLNVVRYIGELLTTGETETAFVRTLEKGRSSMYEFGNMLAENLNTSTGVRGAPLPTQSGAITEAAFNALRPPSYQSMLAPTTQSQNQPFLNINQNISLDGTPLYKNNLQVGKNNSVMNTDTTHGPGSKNNTGS